MRAGLFDFDVTGILNEILAWVIDKATFTIDPMVWLYLSFAGVVFGCVVVCALIAFFLPFPTLQKIVRVAGALVIALAAAFVAGARYMGKIKDAQRKAKPPIKKPVAKKPDGWLWIILACVLFYPVPGFTQVCTPVETVIAKARGEIEVQSVHTATPIEVGAVLTIMDAAGTDLDTAGIDTVLMVTMHDGFGVILLGNGGICWQTVVPPNTWMIFVRSVRGEVS